MPKSDPRVDAYIQNAQPFARPILTELRRRLHAAVPGLTETIKWKGPFFLLDGRRLFASIAGFKAHAKVLLWKADFKSAMPAAISATSLKDLPSAAVFKKLVRASAATFTTPAAKQPARAAKKPSAKRR
ncbi:MAG: DUF1801 domain-containing protein [Myxococcaceae bacterium]|nr:DUF1801 domain-containing protein [Myxococcaceae bacterium]